MGDFGRPAGVERGSGVRSRLTVLLAAGMVAACSTPGPQRAPSPSAGAEFELEAETAPLDPVGAYELTMSSEVMVAEGTMEIRGKPGNYVGTVDIGGMGGRVVSVAPGVGRLAVDIDTHRGRLVLRLVGDGSALSGNWVLGEQRGTIAAKRSTGR